MRNSVLITAGATRNPIDSMRCITANSSGQTGTYIAHHLVAHGMDCTLMGSNLALLQPNCPDKTIEFTSTRDLLTKMKSWILEHPHGIIVHAAAVGDFEVPATNKGKIASGGSITLDLQPTPKIVDEIKIWSEHARLVSFKAAAPNSTQEQLQSIALKQLKRTKSDLIFANVLDNLNNNILLLSESQSTWFEKRSDGINALINAILNWRQDS